VAVMLASILVGSAIVKSQASVRFQAGMYKHVHYVYTIFLFLLVS
jgi:hypothetical protein